MSKTSKNNVYKLTGLAILSAIIIVLQIFTTFVRFGPFSITLALIPIVVGAAMFGKGAGAYLGAVFSAVVVIMCITGGDVGGFMVWSANPIMCVIMCMLKGTMAGLCAGAVYKALSEKNKVLTTYDPSVHDYSVDLPKWVEIESGHYVYGNDKELDSYRRVIEA